MNMRTSINFNIDAKVKSEALKKAKQRGVSPSTVLSETTRAFVDDQLIIGIDNNIVEDIARARNDCEEGAWTY